MVDIMIFLNLIKLIQLKKYNVIQVWKGKKLIKGINLNGNKFS
jgi:hypothetical protein